MLIQNLNYTVRRLKDQGHSFVNKTIREWNHLPTELVEADSLPIFRSQLSVLADTPARWAPSSLPVPHRPRPRPRPRHNKYQPTNWRHVFTPKLAETIITKHSKKKTHRIHCSRLADWVHPTESVKGELARILMQERMDPVLSLDPYAQSPWPSPTPQTQILILTLILIPPKEIGTTKLNCPHKHRSWNSYHSVSLHVRFGWGWLLGLSELWLRTQAVWTRNSQSSSKFKIILHSCAILAHILFWTFQMNFWSLLLFRTGFEEKSVPWKVEIQLDLSKNLHYRPMAENSNGWSIGLGKGRWSFRS